MKQDLVSIIEKDLKQVVEVEIQRFRDKFVECRKVDTIYLNEDLSVGVYDMETHGWRCNYYSNMFIA